MSFFICAVPVCAMRAEAAHRSEQTSQLLFGEMCELLQAENDFVRVKMLYDNYEGWCQASQLAECDEALFQNKKLAGEWINEILINDQLMHIPFGSDLSFLEIENNVFDKLKTDYKGVFIEPNKSIMNAESIKKIAFTCINTPYFWGGRSVFGIDCSGFVQLVFKCLHIPLLRDAYQQATQGNTIDFLDEVKCGDLAFFDNEAGKITHVGILLDINSIIHASGKVRVDTIDNYGIINSDNGKRTHHLKIIKRILE